MILIVAVTKRRKEKEVKASVTSTEVKNYTN
jgi:hypothetical protein